jgi:hypothetical protein
VQKLGRVVDAGLAGGKSEAVVEVLLILDMRDLKGFGAIDGIVENGRRGQICEVVAIAVRHGGARGAHAMPLSGDVKSGLRDAHSRGAHASDGGGTNECWWGGTPQR